jgi:CheY-like chemotaxis protein
VLPPTQDRARLLAGPQGSPRAGAPRLRELHRPALPLYAAAILVVTADPRALRLIGSLLSQAQLEHHARFLDCACRTEQFLTRCAGGQTAAPRALLVDLHLPEADGYRLLRWVRRHRALQSVTVVALGLDNSEQDAAQAFAAGAQAYLPKFSPEPEFDHLGLLLRSVVERDLRARLVSV